VTLAEPSPYRRAVLGLGTCSIDRHVLRAATEFARLLDLEMLGVFVEDRSLIDLAALPFARELRLPGHDWQTLNPGRLGEELRAAADQDRRLFLQEVESQGVTGEFEVRQGDPATLVISLAQTTDILIVTEPAAADALAQGHESVRHAALASMAAVLFLPRSGMARRGPVAAIAATHSDACFRLASRIATATADKAFAISAGSSASPTALLASLQRAFGHHRERLLVLPRKVAMRDRAPLEVARRRGVPVLVMNSEQDQAETIV
jgi:hypothetical protein